MKLLCELNHRALAPTVRGVFDPTERSEMDRQAAGGGGPRRLKAGMEADAVTLLQQFINENCERVEKEYRTLNQTLPTALETVGIDYLYRNYMKDWTSKEGVPLPLP